MNSKKGIGFSAIITLVLGIFVIALLLWGPLRQTYDFAREKFFGEKSLFKTPGEAEEHFVPGVKVSEDEQKLLDSVNALVCGINLAAAKSSDSALCPLSQGRSTQCDAVFGDKCVKCQKGRGIGFSGEKLTIDGLGNFFWECLRTNIGLCGVIKLDNLEKDISASDLNNWLNKNKPDWLDARQGPLRFFTGPGVSISQHGANQNVLFKGKSYYVCTMSLTPKVFIYDDISNAGDCLYSHKKFLGSQSGLKDYSIDTEHYCNVKNFELPHFAEKSVINFEENHLLLSIFYKFGNQIRSEEKSYPLHEQNYPYLIFRDTYKSEDRFSVESICHADLEITTEPCSCAIGTKDVQHYRFSETALPVEMSGITIDWNALSNPDLVFGQYKKHDPQETLLKENDTEIIMILIKDNIRLRKELGAKYPQLLQFDTDFESLLSVDKFDDELRKKYVIAMERIQAVYFYDRAVNGPNYDVYIMDYWNRYKPFYNLEKAKKLCSGATKLPGTNANTQGAYYVPCIAVRFIEPGWDPIEKC